MSVVDGLDWARSIGRLRPTVVRRQSPQYIRIPTAVRPPTDERPHPEPDCSALNDEMVRKAGDRRMRVRSKS